MTWREGIAIGNRRNLSRIACRARFVAIRDALRVAHPPDPVCVCMCVGGPALWRVAKQQHPFPIMMISPWPSPTKREGLIGAI